MQMFLLLSKLPFIGTRMILFSIVRNRFLAIANRKHFYRVQKIQLSLYPYRGQYFRKNTKPNVIFLVDDMGLMDSVPMLVDKEGKPQKHPLNEFYRTPNMERLASQGIRFSQFYAQSVCSPTRVSLMTGQNSARHRVTLWINPESKNQGPAGGTGKD